MQTPCAAHMTYSPLCDSCRSMPTLNQFTGVRTKTLETRLKRLEAILAKIDADEDAGGGGSPREGLLEQIDDIEAELHRRKVEIS